MGKSDQGSCLPVDAVINVITSTYDTRTGIYHYRHLCNTGKGESFKLADMYVHVVYSCDRTAILTVVWQELFPGFAIINYSTTYLCMRHMRYNIINYGA